MHKEDRGRYLDVWRQEERGEWRDCQEICRTILRRYSASLTPAEVGSLLERIRRCTDKLGGYIP